MDAVIICYNLDNLSQLNKLKVHRSLNGYKDNSNNSNYSYRRKGILSQIPHHKPTRGVIVVKKGYKKKILMLFIRYKVSYETFNTKVLKSMLY